MKIQLQKLITQKVHVGIFIYLLFLKMQDQNLFIEGIETIIPPTISLNVILIFFLFICLAITFKEEQIESS